MIEELTLIGINIILTSSVLIKLGVMQEQIKTLQEKVKILQGIKHV